MGCLTWAAVSTAVRTPFLYPIAVPPRRIAWIARQGTAARKEGTMIGMDFISFLILLVISVVVSFILHFPLRYYVTPGLWSFASKIVVGWVGAWLGTPVFGYWWDPIRYQQVYIIPAILGSIALLIVAVDLAKMRGGPQR
jgi:uncharacterized membrane protein YeaQ/YmgE (transglycosylase-associated protein family)